MTTTYRRNGVRYQLERYHLNQATLDAVLPTYPPGSLIVWEAQGARLPDGRRTEPCFVLYVPIDTATPITTRQAQRVPKHKNIVRIDDDERQMHGYLVRVQWQGKVRKDWFADVKLGGRLGALDAAIRFKDAAYSELGKPRTDQQVIGKGRTNTGHIGITRRIKSGKEVFEVFWTEGKKRRSASFGIKEHGERKALQMAIAARRQGEHQRLFGLPDSHHQPQPPQELRKPNDL